jgi:quercetin dioxygenase-like cupin family protein
VGYELWWAQTDDYVGKLLFVNSTQRLSLQLHRHKDESSYLLSGRLRLTEGPSQTGLRSRVLGAGESWRVEPGTVHSIEALEDSVVLEVSTPQSMTWYGSKIATGALTSRTAQAER